MPNGSHLIMKIWDTPGDENKSAMQDFDFDGAEVCVLVYSIDKAHTLESLNTL